MFERIAKKMQPKPSSDKYAGAYEGKPPNTGLATIQEGQEMQRYILGNIQKYRKTPTFIKACNLIAIVTEGGTGKYVGVEKMLTDRFPTDKPIELYVEIEQGSNRPTGDDIGGEEINPAQTDGQCMFNVYDLAVDILKRDTEDAKLATIALFEAIDRAAEVASRGGIAQVVKEEVAANDADNKARAEKKGK
jgi:hypothetical protein